MANAAPAQKFAGIISKPGKTELADIVPPLLAWFREHQYQVVVGFFQRTQGAIAIGGQIGRVPETFEDA